MNKIARYGQVVLLMLAVTACSVSKPIPSRDTESVSGFFSSRIEIANKYMRIGVQSYQEGNYKGAGWMFGKGLDIYQQQHDAQGQVEALINLVEVSFKLDDKISAVDYLKQLEGLVDQSGMSGYQSRYEALKQRLQP